MAKRTKAVPVIGEHGGGMGRPVKPTKPAPSPFKPPKLPGTRSPLAKPVQTGPKVNRNPIPHSPPKRAPATPIVTEHTRGQGRPPRATTPARATGIPATAAPRKVKYAGQWVDPRTVAQIKKGQARQALATKRIMAAGFTTPVHGPFGVLAKIAGNIAEDAVYTPAGLVALGSGVGRDVGAAAGGNLSFSRTRGIGKGMLVSTYESFRYPGRRPGDTLLSLLAGYGTAAKAVSGFGAAARAAEAASEAGRVARAGSVARAFVKGAPPGEINLPGGVQAVEYAHPMWRPVQRLRLKNPTPGTVGREIRARERIEGAVEQAPAHALSAREKRLTPEERTALRVVATEGNHALRHPTEAIGRHVAKHERHVMEGVNPVINAEVANDLRAALPVLQNPSPEFLQAVASARRVSRASQRMEIGRGTVAAASAQRRLVKIAHEYGHYGEGDLVDTPAGGVARHTEGTGNYFTLQRNIDQAETVLRGEKAKLATARAQLARPPKSGGKMRGRPARQKRVQELEANVAEWQGEVDKAHAAMVAQGPTVTPLQPPRGSFYYPTTTRAKYPTGGPTSGIPGRHPGPFGIGPVQPGRFLGGTTRRFTGKGLASGVVTRPGRAIAERAVGSAKLNSVERIHDRLVSLSTPTQEHAGQIEIRAGAITDAHRARVAADLERGLTGDRTALARAHSSMENAMAPEPGEPSVWVDKRYIKDLAGTPGNAVNELARRINKPFRFLGVYARPAYVVQNRPQNWLMRHMAQGRTARPVKGRVSVIRRELGPELSAKIDAAAGTTRTESYQPRGRIGQAEHAMVEGITRVTDADERFLAVLKQASDAGYGTPDQLRRLFADQAPKPVRDKMVAVSRRARKDMADFDALTPAEQSISDFVYFYPWLRAGSAWAGRWALQHPVSTAALAQLSHPGKEMADRALGRRPAWMAGYIPIGGRVVNPAGLWTPSTPVQTAQQLLHPGRYSYAEEFGTPSLGFATTPVSGWPSRAIKSTSVGMALNRAGVLGKPSKTFPDTGPGEALGPFAIGGLFPRRPDPTTYDPARRAAADQQKAQADLLKRAQEYGVSTYQNGVPASVKKAYALRTRRLVAYANQNLKKPTKGATDEQRLDYQRKALLIDIRLLRSQGDFKDADVRRVQAWAKSAPFKDIVAERAMYGSNFFGGQTISEENSAVDSHKPGG